MTAVKDRESIDRIMHDQARALEGFTVMAIDGEAGRVAKGQDRVDDEHLLVHVGSGLIKILGSDVVVETDAIDAIDTEAKEIHVDRIVDWVKASPKIQQFAQDHPGGVR